MAKPYEPEGFIYFFFNCLQCVYVGLTQNLPNRMKQHERGEKIFDSVTALPCPVSLLTEVEDEWKRALRPVYNNCVVTRRARAVEALMAKRSKVIEEQCRAA